MFLWEIDLIKLFSSQIKAVGAKSLKKAYICSPLHDEDPIKMAENMENARQCAAYVLEDLHMRPVCPQAWLPMLVNDYDEQERKKALEFGLQLLKECDCVIVMGNRISSGMQAEIKLAKELKKEILYHQL